MAPTDKEDAAARRRRIRLARNNVDYDVAARREHAIWRWRRRTDSARAAQGGAGMAAEPTTVSQDAALELPALANEASIELQRRWNARLGTGAPHPYSRAARLRRRYARMDRAMHMAPGLQCTPVPAALGCRTRSSTADLPLDPAMFAVIDDHFELVDRPQQHPAPREIPTCPVYVSLSDVQGQPGSATAVPAGYGPTAIARLGEPAARNPPPRSPRVDHYRPFSDADVMIGALVTAECMADVEHTG
ncbi:hypothetical protein HJFPF1_07673 [Paramyrothecium foliicola]|nr:hypothetical protein HJFPF1_07673 [Paramyrothecium foliicola]